MKPYKLFLAFILFSLILSCKEGQKKVSTSKEDESDKQMDKIIELYNSKSWSEIIKYEDFLLKKAEKEPKLLLMISETRAEMGDIEKAIFYIEELINKDPQNYHALLMLGNYYYVLESYDKAESYYFKVLDKKPTYARANLNLALLYERLNKKEEAIDQYLKALELFYANDFKKEVIEYSKAILKLDPNNKIAKDYLSEHSIPEMIRRH